ncbi:hypothetical protein [Bdellovibrio sp. NC01]|uniref:hypothetical protein n=1 Tax=Bdellovibrio sp. NC01 TaxID=2220073 RepID=UPI00115A5857|nr:hypothetical protein [Bdellovibrio sp. NC01]QDK39431.1 hypothetical protein DOE51_18430 [Bdellovibrio sp. NC01]
MNHISSFKNKTTVKTLGILLVGLASFIPLTSQAAYEDCTVYTQGSEEARKCAAANKAASIAQDTKRACADARKDLATANKDMAKVCSEASLGSDCSDKVDECSSVTGSSTFQSAGQVMTALGNQYGTLVSALGGANGGCPQMTGKTYFNRKDSLTKDIDSTQKELADLNDDKAKIQDEFNKQIQDLQDEVNKSQEDLDKLKLEMKEKNRKTLADFQNNQNQMKEELRKKSSDTLNLRGQMISSQQDQALKLIAMTDASGKRACMKAVTDAKKSYDAVASSNSANYIAKAKQKKQDLINTYNDCMDAFEQQRNALNKSKKQEQDQIAKAIQDNEASIGELQNSINSASSQLSEIQADAQTEQDQATQKVVKLMQTTQTKMLAAQQKMQTNLQTLEAKNQSLTAKLNRLNNELAMLGPAPSEDSTKTAKQVGSELGSLQEAVELAKQSVKDNCGGSSSSSRSDSKGVN